MRTCQQLAEKITITIRGVTHMDTNTVDLVLELIEVEVKRLSEIYLGDQVEVRIKID